MAALGLSPYDAGVLTAERAVSDWFEAALAAGGTPKTIANLLTGEVFAKLKELDRGIDAVPFPASHLGELAALHDARTINAGTAKRLVKTMWETREAPNAIVERSGLAQVSDPAAVRAACERAIAEAAEAAASVRGGSDKAMGRLVGLAMRALGGKGDPALVNATLRDLLRA